MSREGESVVYIAEFDTTLCSDGKVINKYGQEYHYDNISIGYRDEGPDAWASSHRFDGPVWYWTSTGGWEYYRKGITVTGYCGLDATLVTIDDDGVNVTKCYGSEY